MLRTVLQYQTAEGRSPYAQWSGSLDATATAIVERNIARLEAGNDSNVKGLGGGLAELKIHFGPGYRVYFGYDGTVLIILLGGGTKARQAQDIATARERWADYKVRKKARPTQRR